MAKENQTPKGTINLGLVKAIHAGTNPPLNKKIIWYDENINKHKSYNPITQKWDLLGTATPGGPDGKAVFTKAWQVSQPGNPNQSNGKNIAVGDTIEDFLIEVFRKSSPAVYNKPTVGISTNPQKTTFEMGVLLTLSINGIFNKNDGGNANSHRIYKNNAVLSNTSSTNDTISLVAGNAFSYKYQADYDAGPIKNNSLGVPDPSGQIKAGTTPMSDTITFQGTYKIFFGAQVPNFTDFRSLNWEWQGTSVIILQSGTIYKDFYIAVPPGGTITEIKDLDALGAVITNSFYITIVNVNDATGHPTNYKLYKLSQGEPFELNHRLQITIS